MGKKDKPQVEVTLYFMNLHYAIAHGPLDYIRQIIVQDKVAWEGQESDYVELLIDKQELFGGVKKGGGVYGAVHYLPGGPAQTIPEILAGKVDLTTATMPAYRGIASLWFIGYGEHESFIWTSNSPFIPATWVKCARTSVGLSDSIARIYRADVTWTDSDQSNVDSADYIFVGKATGVAAKDRKLIIGVGGGEAQNALSVKVHAPDVSADPTGVLATLVKRHIQGTDRAEIWIADVPTETVADIVVVWAASVQHCGIGVWSVPSMANIEAVDTDGNSIDVGSTVTVDTEPGGFVIGYGLHNNTSAVPPSISWSNLTERFDTVIDVPESIRHSGADIRTTGPSLVVGCESPVFNLNSPFAVASFRGGDFDSNPAHIIYECLTNTDWGMGSPPTNIDIDSFEAAAQALYDERFGLSLQWTKQLSIEGFVSEILDHIEATLFINPRTGLLTLKLIRDDYSISGLPEFTPDNSVVTKFGRKLWGETINEIIVSFTNPDNEQSETVVAQDLANIVAQGGIVSDSRNYYGVRVKTLAASLAQRDLRTAASPLASCDIEVNRQGWDLLPGDVLILNSPEDGINSMVMRVGNVDYGKPGDPVVRASLVEDVFSLAAADYFIPPDTVEDEDEEPAPAENVYIFTLPYYLVVTQIAAATLSSIEYPEVFAGVLASQVGDDTAEFELYGEIVDSGGNVTIGSLGTKGISVRATLPSAIAAEVSTVILSFPDRSVGPGPVVGGLMLIGEGDEDTVELCLITAFGGGGYTMRRGVLDTTPKAWPAGTPVWFVSNVQIFADNVIRSAAEVVEYQILTRTALGLLALADAPVETETLTDRPWLPHRPANVKADGDNGFAGVVDLIGVNPIPVTWANRNRLAEDSQILAWDAATVAGEAGQTTNVYATDIDGNVLTSNTGLSGTSYNLDPADFLGEGQGYIVVKSERDGFESLQGHRIHVVVSAFSLLLETGDELLLETGDNLMLEG